ncbi:hypothetical protein POM88_000669 [Heracleum sosnowskyi]|uniref:Uncharacterized protein n=1 Tax=Heracleum sosnowskyi TaxID=360622 RepID=A0AAD8JBK2_9APIA|nr:hypothetical protein POM88_000669 [Heracleum sosnowskyi]
MADKNEDYDDDSDGDVLVTQLKGTNKKNKRKLLIGHGPTTRSPANAAAKPGTEDASEKEGTHKYNKRCHFFRKRVEGREYKTNPEIINKKIKNINEKFSIVDAPDELLSDRKHGPHWLLWRCVKPSKVSRSNAPRDTYVNELTTKIKQGVVAEVEEKVKQIQEEVDEQVNTKVQKNLASVIKNIGQANPNIKIDIDIEELCVTATSDDDGTPITGGSSF